MKLQISKKALVFILSLAMILSCAPLIGATGETSADFSYSQSFDNVAMSADATEQQAVGIYTVNAYTGTPEVVRENAVTLSTATDDVQAYISTQITGGGNYRINMSALAMFNGIDLTDDAVSLNGYSYDVTANSAGNNHIGYMENLTKLGTSIRYSDGAYEVSYGDDIFRCNGGVNEVKGEYMDVKALGTSAKIDKVNISTVYDAGTDAYSATKSGYSFSDYKYYWKGTSKFNVSIAPDGENYRYKVTALDTYSYDGADYIFVGNVDVVNSSLTAEQAAPYLKYVMLFMMGSTGMWASRPTTYSNFKVSYSKEFDATNECNSFISSGNSVVNSLYNDETFEITAANAAEVKVNLQTAKTAFNALSENVKQALANGGYADIDTRINTAISDCNKLIYGEFYKTEIKTESISADASAQSAIALYNGLSTVNNTNNVIVGSGAEDNSAYITISLGGNYVSSLSMLTKFNGADLTAEDVKIKGYSYTIQANALAGGYVGYIDSISSFGAFAQKQADGTYIAIPGSSKYVMNGMRVVPGTNTAYNTLKGYEKSEQYTDNFTYDSSSGSYSLERSRNMFSYYFKDTAANSMLYWNGAPKLDVSIKASGDGYLYKVVASDIYTQSADGTVYTPHDDVTVVSRQLTAEQASPYLKAVLLPNANYSGGRGDRPTYYRNITVEYSKNVDCTDECINVLTSGDCVIDDIYSPNYIITKSNAAAVKAKISALKTAVDALDDATVTAIENSGYANLKSTIDYNISYADVCEKKADPQLLGIQLKQVTDLTGADMRFAISYQNDLDATYTIKGYGALVVPNQAKVDKNAALTLNTEIKSSYEKYFSNVYVTASSVSTDDNSRFYVTVTNSKGKAGTLFDCRPYVIYTDGINDYYLYSDNAVASTGVENGQASKCVLFGAKTMAQNIIDTIASPVYPNGYNAGTFTALLAKVGVTTTTANEKTAILTFIYNNK